MQYINTRWKICTYDVWGNKKDGFEINDVYSIDTIELRLLVQTANEGKPEAFNYAHPSDKQLRGALSIKPRTRLDITGDDLTFYVNHASTGYPFGELRCISHESLSPIREKQVKVKNCISNRQSLTNIRYGKPGKILFDWNGTTITIREPMDVLLIGVDIDSARRWIIDRYGYLLAQIG